MRVFQSNRIHLLRTQIHKTQNEHRVLEYTYLVCLTWFAGFFFANVSACVTETLNAKKIGALGRVKWGFLISILKSKMADKTLF